MTAVLLIVLFLLTAGFIALLVTPNPVGAVCRRELYTLVNGPVGLVSLIAFLLISQTMYAVVIFKYGEASMRPFFEKVPFAFSLVAPLVAMRMWAEERRAQTLELLLTLPARAWAAVSGKFLAGWAFLAFSLGGTLVIPIMLEYVLTDSDTVITETGQAASSASVSSPASSQESGTVVVRNGPDWGPIVGGYAGSLLLAAFTLSIGSFSSALTRDQLVAAIAGILISLLLWSFGHDFVIGTFNNLKPGAGTFLSLLSHQQRFLNLAKGLWDFSDVIYFLSGTGIFLWLTGVMIEKQRA